MSGVAFDDLRWLNLLWAVLLVALAGAYGVWQRSRALRCFAEPHLLARLAPGGGTLRWVVRLAVLLSSLLLLTAAIIGPRWGQREQVVMRRGIDVMVLLDVSRSMLARDIAPNRLERAKLSLSDDLLPALGGDRIGLITFAGLAAMKCPLTNDYGFFRLVLEETGVDSVARGGTLIGDAIRKAADAFTDQADSYRVVLLITDGEDQSSFPVEAAQALWSEHEIPIVSVALGDEREGARIPLGKDGRETYLEYKGETVWSRAKFEDLRRIAAIAPASAFVPVGTRNFDLGEIYREKIVPAIELQRREETERVPLPARYHLFAVAALLLVLLDSFLREGRRSAAAGGSAFQKEAA